MLPYSRRRAPSSTWPRVPPPSAFVRGKLLHHDAAWQIADTILPFDPRKLTADA